MALRAALLLVAIAAPLAAQLTPAIEALSIKRNTGGSGPMGARPGGYSAIGVPIYLVIHLAYPVQGEIIGAPDWFYEEAYDLNARIVGSPTKARTQELWRAAFADRMKLQAHVEAREEQVYALVPSRADGRVSPNLKRVEIDCELPDAPAQCIRLGRGVLTSQGMTMAAFARAIQPTTGRVVVDRTGLAGSYEFSLTFAPVRPNAPIAAGPGDLPSIFAALPDQLGLKLEPARAPVNILIIDRIERPTEN